MVEIRELWKTFSCLSHISDKLLCKINKCVRFKFLKLLFFEKIAINFSKKRKKRLTKQVFRYILILS